MSGHNPVSSNAEDHSTPQPLPDAAVDAASEALKSLSTAPPLDSASISPNAHPDSIVFDFFPKEDVSARLATLKAKAQAGKVLLKTFDLSLQLRCYSNLNFFERSYLSNYFQCLEGREFNLAYNFIQKLFESPAMADEPRGLLAYAIAVLAEAPTARASLVTNATPFSRVVEDDWAYYIALALLKAEYAQPQQALAYIELAELVPHHHVGIVGTVKNVTMRALTRANYNLVRSMPNLRKHADTVTKTFMNYSNIGAEFNEVMKRLDTEPGLTAELLRDQSQTFQRVASRAGNRYYINNWQILEDPQPQPESLWSRLPESVIRHMACVVNWKEYLALASTCKSYHNRMNNSAVWLHVLENKWDLDVTAFDEIIPRNPVVAVQQIHALFRLNRSWWEQPQKFLVPQLEISNAVTWNLSSSNTDIFSRTCREKTPEGVWRLFMSVIAGDRSGKLTRQLVDNGILEYALNSVRTDVVDSQAELALASLCLMYLRSRTTCALVSRFLPPDVAKALARSLSGTEESLDTIMGLHAAVAASQVLYPGCTHSFAYPRMQIDAESGQVSFESPDFEELLKPRPEDFQPAAIELSYTSLLNSGLSANDFCDIVPQKEMRVDKERYNLDFQKRSVAALEPSQEAIDELLEGGAEINDSLQEELALSKSYEEYFEEEDHYNNMRTHEEQMNEAMEGMTMDQVKKKLADMVEGIEPETPSNSHFRSMDDQYRSLIPENSRLAPRFAAAEEEWQLFVVFSGPYSDSVLHRGIARLRISDSTPSSDDWNLEGSGYWTIDQSESYEKVGENALFGEGRYVRAEPSDSDSSVPSSTSDHPDSQAAKDSWKKNHFFQVSGGLVDMAEGLINFDILRGDEADSESEECLWGFTGSGFMFGYQGAIRRASIDEETGEEEDTIIGGFVLIKPEFAHEGAVGKEDLNAFERLAHLPLKIGILSDPDHSTFPSAWDDVPEVELEGDEEPRDPGDVILAEIDSMTEWASKFHTVSQNISFDAVVNIDLGELEPALRDLQLLQEMTPSYWRLFFNTDFEMEPINSIWKDRRLGAAHTAIAGLALLRKTLCTSLRDELDRDFILLVPFYGGEYSVGYPSHDARCYDKKREDNVAAHIVGEKLEAWKMAQVVYFKWVSRLTLFEVVGLDTLRGIRLLIHMIRTYILDM